MYFKSIISICFIQLHLIYCSASESKNIAFDSADLILDYEVADRIVHLEAFKSTSNDKIIGNNDTAKFGQLKWFSLGEPKLAVSANNRLLPLIFKFSPEGFSIKVNMLTKQHKDLFIKEVASKYGIKIKLTQIVSLVASNFDCKSIFINDREKVFIKGRVKLLSTFPLVVDFDVPKHTRERSLLENRIQTDDLNFNCEFSSSGKTTRQNTLILSADQMNQMNLIDDLFGPADSVYVTKQQMAGLSSKLYATLNIIEYYEMPQTEFNENFIQDLFKQTSSYIDKHVSIDEAIASMSTLDIKGDLKADVIKKQMEKLFTIEKNASKDHIKINLEDNEQSKSKGKMNLTDTHNFFILTGFNRRYFSEKEKEWSTSQKSLVEQLAELNNHNENQIQWEFEGEKIIPKSVKVTRLIKTHFLKSLTFSRIKRVYTDAPFKRSFHLSTEDAMNNRYCITSSKTVEYSVDKGANINNKNKNGVTALDHERTILTNFTDGLAVLPNGDLVSKTATKMMIWESNYEKIKLSIGSVSQCTTKLVISPNGVLVKGSFDDIVMWNTEGKEIKRFSSDFRGECVYSIAFLPNGYLACGLTNGKIQIWDANEGILKITLIGSTEDDNWVWDLAVLKNGDLASGYEDGTIKIWNPVGTLKKTLTGHQGHITSLAVLPNGDLASASYEGVIKIWNTEKFTLNRTLIKHSRDVVLAVLTNGDLASGYEDGTIKIWNPDDGTLKKTLTAHKGRIESLIALPNRKLASADRFEIKIWKLQ